MDLEVADRRRLIAALRAAFRTRAGIEALLDDMGYPIARRPLVTDDVEISWRTVLRELEAGVMENGVEALFEALLDRYPGNAEFRRLSAVYAPARSPAPPAPPRAPAPARRSAGAASRSIIDASVKRPELSSEISRGLASPAGPPRRRMTFSRQARTGRPALTARVLLVGCSRYPFDPVGLPDLPAVANNLDQLRELFVDPATGALTREQVTVVTDPADPRAVLGPLIEVARQELDLLVVYYAGHGLLVDGALRLGLAGTTAATAAWTGLEAALVRREVGRALASTKVLLVDSCFSGRLATMADPGSLVESQLDVRGTVTLASSPGDSVSYSPEGESLTAFTGELVRVLRQGVTGRGEMLTVADVYDGVRSALGRRGLPEPRMLHSDRAAHVPLVRNHAWVG